ncbi:hypothetical protein B0I08_101514 [Glaciihabitans tibetensis]|uniref:PH domain-containing protein n=2 Tax=Glaciihabitans tibetensis TaxID=1266600 RepID=A0A2T0VJL3_9MICO|nr:hypothetical protein B0I08_101514 [Glaciihabitans tibetensis]
MGFVVVLLLLLLALMLFGWRARKRRQAGLGQPAPVPEDLGAIRGTFDGLYVATTLAGDPLNRVAVRGLGFRARARLTVAETGVVLALRGEPEVFIPAAALREVTRATWTIDRVVEPGGLVLVGWTLGAADALPHADAGAAADAQTTVDSYFRLEAANELIEALNLIFTAPTGRTA